MRHARLLVLLLLFFFEVGAGLGVGDDELRLLEGRLARAAQQVPRDFAQLAADGGEAARQVFLPRAAASSARRSCRSRAASASARSRGLPSKRLAAGFLSAFFAAA